MNTLLKSPQEACRERGELDHRARRKSNVAKQWRHNDAVDSRRPKGWVRMAHLFLAHIKGGPSCDVAT